MPAERASIRAFVRVMPVRSAPRPNTPRVVSVPSGRQPPDLQYRYWDDVGRQYLQAMINCGHRVKALCSSGGVDLADPRSPWAPLVVWFGGLLADSYLNVVIGDNGDLVKLYTVGCLANVAITDVYPREPNRDEQHAMRRYDAVLAVTNEGAAALRKLGITQATYVPPATDALGPILARFFPASTKEIA